MESLGAKCQAKQGSGEELEENEGRRVEKGREGLSIPSVDATIGRGTRRVLAMSWSWSPVLRRPVYSPPLCLWSDVSG